MAHLLDKEEVGKLLEKIQWAYKQMSEKNLYCPVCHDLYTKKRRDIICWCDYESPAINYE